MHEVDLSGVDLNLLKVFEALERAGSATKAGELLGVGQPSVSHALGRLRALFRDELFVRGAAGLVPTPRARALAGPVRAALAMIEAVLRGVRAFEPATAGGVVRLAMSDIGAVTLLPAFLARLRALAPGIDVLVRPTSWRGLGEALDAGEVELAGGVYPVRGTWHRGVPLYEEDYVCVFNPSLVEVGEALTLERFLAERHLLVSREGERRGRVDGVLRALGRERRVGVVVPYFLAAGQVLQAERLVAALPRRFAMACCAAHGLAARELPFASPRHVVSMVWHARHDDDARHAALRDVLRAAAG